MADGKLRVIFHVELPLGPGEGKLKIKNSRGEDVLLASLTPTETEIVKQTIINLLVIHGPA